MSGLKEEAVSATKATGIFLEHKTNVYAQKNEIQTSIDQIISFGRIKRIIISNEKNVVLQSIDDVLVRDKLNKYDYEKAQIREGFNLIYSCDSLYVPVDLIEMIVDFAVV